VRRLAHEGLPLRQGGGAAGPVGLSIDQVAFGLEVVVHAGVDRGELLERLDPPEVLHHPFSSPKRQMRALNPVVGQRPISCLVSFESAMVGGPRRSTQHFTIREKLRLCSPMLCAGAFAAETRSVGVANLLIRS